MTRAVPPSPRGARLAQRVTKGEISPKTKAKLLREEATIAAAMETFRSVA